MDIKQFILAIKENHRNKLFAPVFTIRFMFMCLCVYVRVYKNNLNRCVLKRVSTRELMSYLVIYFIWFCSVANVSPWFLDNGKSLFENLNFCKMQLLLFFFFSWMVNQSNFKHVCIRAHFRLHTIQYMCRKL